MRDVKMFLPWKIHYSHALPSMVKFKKSNGKLEFGGNYNEIGEQKIPKY